MIRLLAAVANDRLTWFALGAAVAVLISALPQLFMAVPG
jgi:hypothetical protein